APAFLSIAQAIRITDGTNSIHDAGRADSVGAEISATRGATDAGFPFSRGGGTSGAAVCGAGGTYTGGITPLPGRDLGNRCSVKRAYILRRRRRIPFRIP